ncbi:hypothetical protein [Chelativorans xinjiangense]|uniref:hypothetical protein n=1 Tax=Chelativorans xinjiangense TaxID=2681485 RepID=UPI001356E541|nr:hypothetical protein [Chelativorans xinjiangense]
MTAALNLLGLAARYGRLVLILGLVAGIALPGLALALRPWIGSLIAALLFLAALRVGPRQAVGALSDLRNSIGFALVFQVALPVAALIAFQAVGWAGALAIALVLMMAASPISGSPNLTMLTGNDPAPALRQLVVGTALLPLTVIPVFWLSPALGEVGEVLAAAGRLLAIIALSAAAAFLIRGLALKTPSPAAVAGIDGLSAIVMAVVVVGLMSAVGPAIRSAPQALGVALFAAFAGNFGLQILVAAALRRAGNPHLAAPFGIVAGNRNIALFLTALPAAVTDPLLLFIGCYQIPMYLTPILMGWLYGTGRSRSSRRAG